MQQNGVLYLACELCDGEAVLRAARGVAGAVFLYLRRLALARKRLEAVLYLGHVRALAAREVQMAHRVAAGAELFLHLARLPRRESAFAVLRLHEFAKLRLGHLCAQLHILLLPRAGAAVSVLRVLGDADAEFAERAAPLLLTALMQRGGYETALGALALLRAYLEPALKKLLCARDDLLRRHIRREFQLVQQLPVPETVG